MNHASFFSEATLIEIGVLREGIISIQSSSKRKTTLEAL